MAGLGGEMGGESNFFDQLTLWPVAVCSAVGYQRNLLYRYMIIYAALFTYSVDHRTMHLLLSLNIRAI
jgi:hypothetical protein